MPSKRAPPNSLIDLWTGPLGAPPSTLYAAAVPARQVTSSDFHPETIGGAPVQLYVTLTSPLPQIAIAAGVGTTVTFDWRTADQVALVTGGPPTHFVVFVDVWFPSTSDEYYRVWLAPLPLP